MFPSLFICLHRIFDQLWADPESRLDLQRLPHTFATYLVKYNVTDAGTCSVPDVVASLSPFHFNLTTRAFFMGTRILDKYDTPPPPEAMSIMANPNFNHSKRFTTVLLSMPPMASETNGKDQLYFAQVCFSIGRLCCKGNACMS